MLSSGGRRVFAYLLFQVWEACVFVFAFLTGLFALENAGILKGDYFANPDYMFALLLLLLLWVGLLHAFGLYDSRRFVKRSNEVVTVIAFVTGVTAGFAMLGAFLGLPFNEPEFLGWFMAVSLVMLVSGRMVIRLALRAARLTGRDLRRIAIVGADARAQDLVRTTLMHPGAGGAVIGFFDDAQTLRQLPSDLPSGGTIADLKVHLMRDPVDEVLIALPLAERFEDALDMLTYCRRVGVAARVTADALRPGTAAMAVEYVGDHPTIFYANNVRWGWQGRAKHAIDFVASLLGLIALSPLFAAVAVLIKLDSPGPVFFRQARVGKDRRAFRLYKFRTMAADAEARQGELEARNEAAGPVFKMRNDPRVTNIGAVLRRFSIDELPQLINVLKGEMSLVGPRPLPLRDVARFDTDWHARRFSVRPGLTCSWVLAGRSELSFDTWVQMDLDYIDDWSLLKDFRICLGTIPLVLRGSGAY